jgi:DMSO/TMAO reductase YedYZ molybdopterin-dependent catalytic subunit
MTTAIAARLVGTRRLATARFARVGAGTLAGLVAALAMTALMALARWWIGLPTPAELIGDVFIPSLNLDQFFSLIGRFGGGNGIKRAGIGSVLLGQLVAGTIAGGVYGALGGGRRGRIFVAAAGLVAWLVTIVPLRPVLHTNYRGLPAGPATALTVAGILLLYAAFGLALTLLYRWMVDAPAESEKVGVAGAASAGRRALIVAGAGVVTAAAAGGLVRLLYDRSTLHYDGTRYRGPDVQPITPNERFYSVTKNILDPDIARPLWRLRLDGRVASPRTFTFDELAALPGVTTQEATISCISNDVGDGLASNAVWTGIPLRALLEPAGLQQPTVKVVLHGADNYTDTISLDKALDGTTFVAWEMNGAPLPRRHGYPVRIIVPGRFGEKSVKWVTRIEVVDREVQGFYERQGWGPTFVTQTFSRFDAPVGGQTLRADEGARLHGVAFAGDRGIERVEISTDDGQTWADARLDYRSSRIAWVLWSLEWRPVQAGEYKLAVRAVDGTGAYQTSDTRGIAPDGASGYHRITVRVEG